MIRALARQAKALWPHHRGYRRQWVRSMLFLGDKHILKGGVAKWGNLRIKGTP